MISRGDYDAGSLLVVLTSRGENPVLFERFIEPSGGFVWRTSNEGESLAAERVAQLVAKKKRFDRDIWVIELDIPDVPQFIVDSLPKT